MFYVYVLQSEVDSSLYIGQTEDLRKRLQEHNAGKTKSIKSKTPFKLLYSESYQTRSEAVRRERQIKESGKIRHSLKNGNYYKSNR